VKSPSLVFSKKSPVHPVIAPFKSITECGRTRRQRIRTFIKGIDSTVNRISSIGAVFLAVQRNKAAKTKVMKLKSIKPPT
jgi:hypothetical protein